MKKIIILITSFFVCINVFALTCSYSTPDGTLTMNVNVDFSKKTWLEAYSFSGTKEGSLFNESLMNGGSTVIAPHMTDIFARFAHFGSNADDGTCPVLVSIGKSQYTVMPYSTYVTFFAPENVLYCQDCNNNMINAIDINGNENKYTFVDICKYFSKNRETYISVPEGGGFTYYDAETVPFLGFLYYHEYYRKSGNLRDICSQHTVFESGLVPGRNLIDYLIKYKEQFFIGEADNNNVFGTCPLVTDVNQTLAILDCLNEKRDILKTAAEEFSLKCTEREMRAIQAYASGSTANFFDKHNVSGYLNNEIKLLFGSFSDECANAADNLYYAVSNSGRVLNAYIRQESITRTMSYLVTESEFLIGKSLLANVNPTVKIESDACNLISKDLKNIIKEILNAVKIGAVILVVVLSIVEVYKGVMSGEDGKKKISSMIVKRVVALIVLLILPSLIMLVIDLINKYAPVDTSRCVISELNK